MFYFGGGVRCASVWLLEGAESAQKVRSLQLLEFVVVL